MDGVTTAIVLAVFAGVFWPHAIKNRQQFYFAIGAVVLILLFESLDSMFGGFGTGFHKFASAIEALLQIIGILGIILAASGQTVSEFAADTIEVVRRGDEETEVLIKGAGTRRAAARDREQVDESGRINLGSTDDLTGRGPLRPNVPPPPPSASPPPAPPTGAPGTGPIPLDE
jgi:hypothetical protein